MDSDFLTNNSHIFVQRLSNKFMNFDHSAAGYQPGSWLMAEFSRFTPEAPEEEIEVDGEQNPLPLLNGNYCIKIHTVNTTTENASTRVTRTTSVSKPMTVSG